MIKYKKHRHLFPDKMEENDIYKQEQQIKITRQRSTVHIAFPSKLILVLTVLSFLQSVNGQTNFRQIFGNTSPQTIGATSVISLSAVLPSGVYYATGDTVIFDIPSPGLFTPSTSVSNCVSQTNQLLVGSCTIAANKVTMTVNYVSTSSTLTLSFNVKVSGFINPPSTSPINNFMVTLTNSTATRATTSPPQIITNFLPDSLNAASLTSSSNVIADTDNVSLIVTITPKNTLKANGFIFIDFPILNPQNSNPNQWKHMMSTSPVCTGITNMKATFPCSYTQSSRRLQISEMVNSDITGGSTQISFSISTFSNPVSAIPKSGFYVTTADSQAYFIDQSSSLSVTVTSWAAFPSAQVYRADSINTVDELSEVGISFATTAEKSDFYVEPNCMLRIDFPSDQPVTSDLTAIQGDGLFAAYSSFSKNIAGNYLLVYGCTSTSGYQMSGYVQMAYLLNANQVATTKTFKISLYAVYNSQNYAIAQQTSDLQIASSILDPGEITSFTISAVDSPYIQSTTRFKLTILPQHSIPTNSKLIITFPSSIALTNQASCTLSTVSGGVSTSPSSCVVSGNTLTITNPFGTGSYTKNGSALSFIFSVGGTNPTSVVDAGTFTVESESLIDTDYYTIDRSSFSGIYSPLPFVLNADIFLVSSYETYHSPSAYTIEITPNKQIPIGGVITIKFPTQISLLGSGFTSCQITIGSATTSPTGCNHISASPPYLNITGGFTTAAYTTTGTPFYVKLGGLVNPRTTALTDSFYVATTDSSFNAIEALSTGITVQMTSTPNITIFTVTPGSFVTGDTTSYTIAVTVPLPVVTTDTITMTFPSEITLPSSISCTPQTSLTGVTCSLVSANTIKATLSVLGGTLAASTQISFNLLNVKNPASTKATSAFSGVSMSDTNSLLLSRYYGTPTVQMTTPATVQAKTLTQLSEALATATQYTITYITINDMASGAAFLITYPTTVTVTSISSCSIQASSTYTGTCQVVSGSRQIKVSGLTAAVGAGSSIVIVLSQITNPNSQQATESFSLTSYTDNSFTYSYDNIPDGLVPQFECAYPCKTCPPDSKSTCLSCITDVASEPYIYLNGTSCLSACPDGWYSDSNLKCQKCPSECKTCSSATTCLSCDTTSLYAYLLEGWCYTVCPNSMCSVNWQCQFCTLAQFTSITVTPTTKTVSATSNTVSITSILPSGKTYSNGAIITYLIPSPASFTPSTSSSLCTSSTNGVTVSNCLILANQVSAKISLSSSSLTSLTLKIGNFNNPPSTCTVTGIIVTLVDSSGNSVAQFLTATMNGLIPAVMTAASVSSSSQIVGATGSILTVAFSVVTSLSSSNYIQLEAPYWNPSSSSPSHLIQSPSPTCVGTAPLSSSPTCAYSFDSSRKLTARSVLGSGSSALTTGTGISFTVSDFENPYSGAPNPGFIITTYDSSGCSIDQSNSLSLQVTDWAALSLSSITRQDSITEVNQYSVLTASFSLQYPIDQDCRLRIYLPSDMPVDSSFSSITGSGLFASSSTYKTLSLSSNYIEIDGCSSYSEGGETATVSLTSIKNKPWVQETQTFKYELYKFVGSTTYQIARTTSGIVLPITAFSTGAIQDFSIVAIDSETVQDLTTFKLTILPLNSIPTDSKIQVIFPSSMTLTQQSACTLSSVSGGISASGFGTCTVVGNTLTITNPFGTGSYTKNGSALSFIFSVGGTNPSTVADAGAFQVSTFAVIGSSTYAIDDSTFTGKYTPSPALLSAQVLSISSTVTSNYPSTYTIQITPNKTIPAGGNIIVAFPSQITLPSGGSITTCQANLGSVRTVNCALTSSSPITVTVSNVFLSDYTSKLTPFTIILGPVRNPRTMQTTGSFSITTQSSSGMPIEAVSAGITVAMSSVPEMNVFTIIPSNFINGNKNDYLVSVQAGFNLISTDVIKFTFPTDFSISSPSCSAQTQLQSVSCSAVGNAVTAVVTFTTSPLSSGTTFAFYIKNINNPQSTKPTAAFANIAGFDTSSNQIIKFSGAPVITTTTPATVQTQSLSQGNTNLGVATTYSLTFTSINLLPSGSTFVIKYPPAVTPTVPFTTCQINSGSQSFTMNSCAIDTSSKTITLSNGFGSALSGGASIVIKIGPITNPTDYGNTDSFTIKTYTDNTINYIIDQVVDGLIPGYACTLPCRTCTASSKTQCTSCFTSSTLPYLSGQTCINKCPDGTYGDSSFLCQTCPSTCKTCANSTTCLTCDTSSTSTTKLLYNGKCVATCPDGTYNSSGSCLACNLTLCKTCQNSSTTCTSCPASRPFLTAANQCQTSCDAGYVSVNYVCTKCKSPCATCLVSTTTCTSCLSGLLYGTTCISECPTGYTLVNGRCVGCDPNCQQCSATNSSQCLLCNKGYFVINSTCFSSCPEGYKADANNITCIPQSTGGGEVVGTVSETNIYNSIIAYFPFLIIALILGLVSVGGWWKDRKSIIPSNCVAMWGPLLFLALGVQVVLSYLWITNISYEASVSVTTTNTTSSLQLLTEQNTLTNNNRRFLGSTAMLANFGSPVIPIVFYGTVFALVIFLLLNLCFLVIFLAFIRRDPGYKEYRRQYCCTPTAIVAIGVILGFQTSNFYYSRFFGLRSFFVPLQEKVRLHTILNILTIIHIVLCLLPVIFVDVYGLLKYKWGSQFFMEIIETFVLCLLLLGFKIWDFSAQKQALKPEEADLLAYAGVPDMSMEEERRLDEERKRYNGMTMEEYLNHLLNQKEIEKAAYDTRRPLKRANSMGGLGDRSMEEDDRRVNTDPLDEKQKKRYERWEGSFDDDRYPNNCYAVPGDQEKKTLDPSKIRKKVIQYGADAEDGEDYDKEYERKIRELFHGMNPADERNDLRYQTQMGDQTEDGMTSARKKNRMRGRKGKYYEQVDDEDQTFLQDQERDAINDDEYDEEDGPDGKRRLDMIEEESHHDDDGANRLEQEILETSLNPFIAEKHSEELEDETRKLNQSDLHNQTQDGLMTGQGEGADDLQETQLFEAEEAKGENAMREEMTQDGEKQQRTPQKQNVFANAKDTIEHLLEEDEEEDRQQQMEGNLQQVDEENANNSDEALSEAQMLLTQRNEEADNEAAEPPRVDDQHQQEEEIIKHEEEKGEPDSDDDDDQRIANMRDPNKRRFNVNDILGEFDRDEKGNLVILQENRTGNLIDKDGNRVNEKGYRIDEKTGDVVEKEKGKKVFDSKELDERGELPPPYNLERFNFNAHDVRGYFDRDEHGKEIIPTKRDASGRLLDKQGRRVNEHGYLVDEQGNLVDKRGRIKLHKSIMDQNDGELPQLFNYKGKKFNLQEIMGALDKDRNGNIIIRRDKDNNMVDKFGRRVNKKGYLIDQNGNVINKDGKMMFDVFALSKDDEIPKLFPFLKFNIDDIKGDYEMDPLGNPMLHTTRDGQLVDAKGRRVNSRGYLLDNEGNIRNKRGHKVFNHNLLEDGEDIPKVFRTGLLRKDTYDSFSQLMSEIEDLERMQEMDLDDPRRQQMKDKMNKENERLQKRIDQIVEEDLDDDDMLMKEVEKLAQGTNSDGDDDGAGNTSVESQMEDTPSNYNVLNQRFNEIDEIKNQAKQNARAQRMVPEEFEYESEYSYLPGKKLKKKKKKKKKKAPKKEPEIDLRELKMAVAYGGLSQAQYDKIVATQKIKDAQNLAAQLPSQASFMNKPPIQRNASNTRMTTVQSKRGPIGFNQRQPSMIDNDVQSELGAESVNLQLGPNTKMAGANFRVGTSTTRAGQAIMHKTQSRLTHTDQKFIPPVNMQLRKNNLMSDKGDNKSEQSDQLLQSRTAAGDRERRLSQIANSVSGFYINKEGSEQSLMRSTHESNFAQNLGKMGKRQQPPPTGLGGHHFPLTNPLEESKIASHRAPNTAGFGAPTGDPELDRIYGTARGLADLTQLSDWEKDSQKSGKSAKSQFTQMNAFKVRGLENIYLQRLEPASKGRSTALKNQPKAKFRMMHHKFHDEPEWHVDDENRDELDSVISDNYKQMEMKFMQEFQGSGGSGGKGKKGKKGKGDKHGINIFSGNLNQYKDIKSNLKNKTTIDFNKS